jgi:Fe-Mn family superoxide dismutase
MKFELPDLPYEMTALEPYIAAETLQLHYGKHHQGYMDKLKKALSGDKLAEASLEHIVRNSSGAVFNNAAQVWNHSFYWQSMSPEQGKSLGKDLAYRFERDFGGLSSFKRKFAEVAKGHFGSGWAWLVENADGKLDIVSTSDADNPMCHGATPILTLDVWEHAYYLDYQNDRAAYVEAFLDHLANWKFAEQNLGAETEQKRAASG